MRLDPDVAPLPDKLLEEAACTSPTSLLQLSLGAIECFNIFYRLHRLAMAVSSTWIDQIERLTLSNLLYELQFSALSISDYSHRFSDLQREHQDQDGQDEGYLRRKSIADAASVVESLLAAVQMFVYAALRGLPPNARIFTVLADRLRAALEYAHVSLIDIWRREGQIDMLLWVLVVACSVLPPHSGRTWWIKTLSVVCVKLEVSTPCSLRGRLMRVAWSDVFFDGAIWGIWEEMVRLQLNPHRTGQATTLDKGWLSLVDPRLVEADSARESNGVNTPMEFEDGRWKINGWFV